MFGQYLSHTNKRVTVAILQKISQVNKAQLLITLRTLKRLENFPPISLSNKETSQFRVDRPQPNPALGANLPFFKPCTKAEQIPCLLIASITDPSMDIDETMSRVRLLYVV
jgi:hypothetical protein